MISDVHAHLFHPKWYPQSFCDSLVRNFLTKKKNAGQKANPDTVRNMIFKMLSDESGEKTIQIMDTVGIDKRVILIVDWGYQLGEAPLSIRQIHKDIFSICNHFPDRLIGFTGVDPRRKEADEILTWAFDHLGARGLKLHPTGSWRLTDSATHKIVHIASERQKPVMVHIGKTVDVLSSENSQIEPFLKLAENFPDIPFIAAHCGFNLWKAFLKIKLPENIYFDISGWQELEKNNEDGILNDIELLHHTYERRVFFGTDNPFYSFNIISSEQKWINRIVPPFYNSWPSLDDIL